MLVQHHGRVIQVKALPIGIPYSRFEALAKTSPSVYGENSLKVSFFNKNFSLKVRRSRKIQQILKILIFKDFFLTHTTFLLTKYFSKFCHFFILLHKFQNFQKNFKILKFFQNFSEICQN